MLSENNHWLVLDRSDSGILRVDLNKLLDGVIYSLDPVFESLQLRGVVTSGVRTRQKQIEIIRQKALRHNLDSIYLDIVTGDLEQEVMVGSGKQPYWQILWSQLLSIGEIVNPPQAARAEYDYVHPARGIIRAGHLVGVSPHQLGKAFDIARGDLSLIDHALTHARQIGIPNIKGWLIEPVNNCVHCDCEEMVS